MDRYFGFNQLVILRPSLLLGERSEMRFAERLSGFIMKALKILIPDNYKAIRAEKVADSMLKIALKSTGSVSIVKSGEMLRDLLFFLNWGLRLKFVYSSYKKYDVSD